MKRILVLGGGQLGLMLAEAASRLGIQFDRIDPEQWTLLRGTSPVAEPLPDDWRGEEYDLVTVEREHFPDRSVLERFADHPGFRMLHELDQLADRRSQKALLDELDIANAEWCTVSERDDIIGLQQRVGCSLVLKSATGGYDGRGQWRIDDPQPELPSDARPGYVIAERAVAFERELSLVGARNEQGECVFYPLVENVHREGMLFCTVAPAALAAAQQSEAEDMLRRVMDALKHVGTMAMECFEEQGRLLVNELAPRVHNSGHWSQEGSNLDQFELHLRALSGLPMTRPRVTRTTVMVNLVGVPFNPSWLKQVDGRLHWYGKGFRPGRKLGHFNIHGADAEALKSTLEAMLTHWAPEHLADIRTALAILERGNTPEMQGLDEVQVPPDEAASA